MTTSDNLKKILKSKSMLPSIYVLGGVIFLGCPPQQSSTKNKIACCKKLPKSKSMLPSIYVLGGVIFLGCPPQSVALH